MVDSKKKVKQNKQPIGNIIRQGGNPEQYYFKHPAWNFSSCDREKWSIFSKEVQELFWSEILPCLQELESQNWNEILIGAKKKNHSIDVKNLNKIASDRLEKLYIEADSLISLRLTGKHRIYGYMNGAIFNILWIDLEHGDNERCVCRSCKKHT